MKNITLPIDLDNFDATLTYSIDMSKIDWEFFGNSFEQIFIYLRNLDLNEDNIHYDFSKCDYYIKSMFLNQYAQSKIRLNISCLNYTLCLIFQKYLKIHVNVDNSSILSLDEIHNFINANKHLIVEWLSILKTCIFFTKKLFDKSFCSQVDTYTGNILNCLAELHKFDIALISDKNIPHKNCSFDKSILALFKSKWPKSVVLMYGTTLENWNTFCELTNLITIK